MLIVFKSQALSLAQTLLCEWMNEVKHSASLNFLSNIERADGRHVTTYRWFLFFPVYEVLTWQTAVNTPVTCDKSYWVNKNLKPICEKSDIGRRKRGQGARIASPRY